MDKESPFQKHFLTGAVSPSIRETLGKCLSKLSFVCAFIAGSAAESVETPPSVYETHTTDMDSNERDDVPLARLLKKGLFSIVFFG